MLCPNVAQVPAPAPTTNLELRDWLRRLKEASGASYAEIARSIGEEERTVKRWMTSEAPVVPRGDSLLRLLNFFGVELSSPAPDSAGASLMGEIRALRTYAASSLAERTAIGGRLEALEAKVDAMAQTTAASLARLASAIDELSEQLQQSAPGDRRVKGQR